MASEDVELVISEAQEAMDKSLRGLKAELQKVRTGRASTALLEGIQVDYYGSPTPLNQLANMSTPDPRLIVISPFDKGAMPAIEKAIQTSDLGLTPSNDGKVVRIPIPPLTEERRKELVKHV
ncbi:MAG: ribosome recycling factor, partial [Myxococcota bacterium]